MKIKFSLISARDHKGFEMKTGETICIHNHDKFGKPEVLPEIRITTERKNIFSPLSIVLMIHPAKILGGKGLEWGSAERTIK